MTTANLAPANEILNRVAAEVGLAPVSDPYASTDSNFIQMKYLLNSAGEELSIAHQWEFLNKTFSFTTASTDTGSYDLPDDFLSMVQQTGWDKSTRTPLAGALSPQEWAYWKVGIWLKTPYTLSSGYRAASSICTLHHPQTAYKYQYNTNHLNGYF